MGIKISALPAAAGAASAMQFEVNNAGVSQRLTLAQMFALSMGAVTVDTPLLNLAQTWNAGAVTFTGWKLNVTDTTSAAASKLLDLQVGGSSKFNVTKAGKAVLTAPDAGAFHLEPLNSNQFRLIINSAEVTRWNSSAGGGLDLGTGSLRFGVSFAAYDTILTREAAGTLAQRNGTNAQEFRCYNSYTDASNYERGFVRWNSNVLEFGTDAAGTGSSRGLQFFPAGSVHRVGINTSGRLFVSDGNRIYLSGTPTSSAGGYLIGNDSGIGFGINNNTLAWKMVGSTGSLLAQTDNTYDIGASGANRPRDLYLAGGLTHGAATLLATTTALTNGAGANAGTLSNAPLAGNPTKWIPINDNGTTRYIPAW